MEKRYQVVEGSLTGNENMTHSVIDTHDKAMYDLERMVCESHSEGVAQSIADALNASEPLPTQNKVEKAHIDAMVESLDFKFERVGDTTVTGCWAFMPNGFKVGYGESACVDPANYNQADGEKYSKQRAIQAATNKLWELEGYLLKMTGRTSANAVNNITINVNLQIDDMDEFQGLTQTLLDNLDDLPAPVMEALEAFINKPDSE